MSTRSRLRSTIRAAALIGGLALLATGCSASAPAATEEGDTVTVNIGPTNSYQSLSVAQTTGALDADLEAIGATAVWKGPFPAFAPALEAANAGEIDLGSGGTTNYVTAVANGAEIVVLGIEDISPSTGIVATEASGIETVEDLRGKKVAVNQGGTGEYLLLRALDRAGIDADEVERVYLSPEDGASAFDSNNVDAWATWDQYFASVQLTPGAKVITTGTELESLNWTLQWATKEFADAHPELLQPITDTLAAASAEASENTELIAELYRNNGATEEVIEQILTWPTYDFYSIGEAQVAQLEQHAADLERYGLIDSVPDLTGTYFEYEQ